MADASRTRRVFGALQLRGIHAYNGTPSAECGQRLGPEARLLGLGGPLSRLVRFRACVGRQRHRNPGLTLPWPRCELRLAEPPDREAGDVIGDEELGRPSSERQHRPACLWQRKGFPRLSLYLKPCGQSATGYLSDDRGVVGAP